MEMRWGLYLWKAVLRIYDEKAGLSATTVSYLEAMSRVEVRRGWVRLTGREIGCGTYDDEFLFIVWPAVVLLAGGCGSAMLVVAAAVERVGCAGGGHVLLQDGNTAPLCVESQSMRKLAGWRCWRRRQQTAE